MFMSSALVSKTNFLVSGACYSLMVVLSGVEVRTS